MVQFLQLSLKTHGKSVIGNVPSFVFYFINALILNYIKRVINSNYYIHIANFY
jgi:hypothetical protein